MTEAVFKAVGVTKKSGRYKVRHQSEMRSVAFKDHEDVKLFDTPRPMEKIEAAKWMRQHKKPQLNADHLAALDNFIHYGCNTPSDSLRRAMDVVKVPPKPEPAPVQEPVQAAAKPAAKAATKPAKATKAADKGVTAKTAEKRSTAATKATATVQEPKFAKGPEVPTIDAYPDAPTKDEIPDFITQAAQKVALEKVDA